MSDDNDEKSCFLLCACRLFLPDTRTAYTCPLNVDIIEYESDHKKNTGQEEKYPKFTCEVDREVAFGCPDGYIIHSHQSLD
jgi:hypothetical protein